MSLERTGDMGGLLENGKVAYFQLLRFMKPGHRTPVLGRSPNHVPTRVVGTDVRRPTHAHDGARSGGTDHRMASAKHSMPRRGEELPMFARHLSGPAAELGHLNLLAEVKCERQLALAAAQETSPA